MNTPFLPDRQGQVLQRNCCRVEALPLKTKKVRSTTKVPKTISTSSPGFLDLMMTDLPSSQVDWHELICAASALVSSAPTLEQADNFASLDADLTDFENLGIQFDFHAALAPEDPSAITPRSLTRHVRARAPGTTNRVEGTSLTALKEES
ncbi:hypothetical protein Esti_003964 [Eimeria stiedai]